MKKILVYPCGTEIGLEIYKAINNSIHYELYGGSCCYDHGRFVYKNHIGDLPFITDRSTAEDVAEFNRSIAEYGFDFIFPAMDGVLTVFSQYRELLSPVLIAADYEVTCITRSKRKIYELMEGIIPVPAIYDSPSNIHEYPVFLKPDVGQGSVGTSKIENEDQLEHCKFDKNSQLLLEYLPGKEYTVDCFTNAVGELIFCQGRERKRIKGGISVNAVIYNNPQLELYAQRINSKLKNIGGWFFQVKEDSNGELKLLEIASRIAGASAIQRCRGVNLPLLTVDTFNGLNIHDVIVNNYDIELDRALDNCYKIEIDYESVYIDYDDTVVCDGKINTHIIHFLGQCINENKRIVLITKHDGDIVEDLHKYRIYEFFDEIIHIDRGDEKYKYVKSKNAIFIDDSYGERKKIAEQCGISVFDTNMIECLIKE